MRLTDCYISAAVRCAPPANKPTPVERDACQPFLEAELDLLTGIQVVVALGKFGYDQLWRVLQARREPLPKPKTAFAHGVEIPVRSGLTLLGSYHPSQQNTFTGTLTEEMFDRVWSRARNLIPPGKPRLGLSG